MKKKVFRERYAKNVVSVETFDKHIKNPPEVEVKPKKKRASKKKESGE